MRSSRQHLAVVCLTLCTLLEAWSATALKRQQGTRTLPRGRQTLAALAKPDYDLYHRKDVLLQKVQDIVAANRGTFAVETRNVSDSGYSTEVMVVTVDLGGIASSKAAKARYLVDFGEHARELISSELGLHFLQTLADPNAIRAVLGGSERGDELYRTLTQEVAFKILPLENVRGRELVEKEGKLCERKNGRGVDPNRNWEVDWGKKEKDYDPNEEFPGAKPFSEPEVQVVLSLAKDFKPHVWLNMHSGMEALFTPWDHQATVPDAAKEALAMLQSIQKDFFADHKDCVVGSGGKSVGYLAHGTATDYMFEVLKVPLPFTWEIFGDLQADFHDCFKMFNPINKEQYDATISVWLKAMFRLIEMVPKHTVVSADLQAAKQEQQQKQEAGQPGQGGQQQQLGMPPEVVVVEEKGAAGGSAIMWFWLGVGVVGLVSIVVAGAWYMKSTPDNSGQSGRRRGGNLREPV